MANYPPRFGAKLWPIIHLNARRLDIFTQLDYHRLQEKESKNGTADTADSQSFMRDWSKDREALWNFLNNIQYYVPCPQCSTNYLTFLGEDPLLPNDIVVGKEPHRDLYFQWSVRAHNHANRITGKREITYEEAEEMYFKEWIDPDVNIKLSHAQKIRNEDHIKIRDLEEKLRNAQMNKVNIALAITTLVIAIISTIVISWLLWTRK